jgi:hypothetical protein
MDGCSIQSQQGPEKTPVKKPIATEMNAANIASVLEMLTATPHTLVSLSKDFAPEALTQPLKAGERSFVEIVAHIIHCDERTTEAIYAALLLETPQLLDIHPERRWGKLLRYDQFECVELMAYFQFRRKALLMVLNGLTDIQWGRTVREMGKQREESVFWRARGQALHEAEHLGQIETRFS